jgi:hypothetical protein
MPHPHSIFVGRGTLRPHNDFVGRGTPRPYGELIEFTFAEISRQGSTVATCLQEHCLFGEIDYLYFGGGVCFLFHLFARFLM